MYGYKRFTTRREHLQRLIVILALLLSICGASYFVVTPAKKGPGWRMKVNRTHLIVADGVIYLDTVFPLGREVENAPKIWTIYALDAETGTVLWRFQEGEAEMGAAVWGSQPVDFWGVGFEPADGTVYAAASNRNFYAIDAATGKKKWEYETEDTSGDWTDRRSVAIDVEDRAVYFLVYSRFYSGSFLYALEASTGKKKWSLEEVGKNDIDQVAAGKDAVYVFDAYVSDTPQSLYALDPESGIVKWELAIDHVGRFKLSELLIHDEGIYFVAKGKQDHFTLYAVEAATGKIRWKHQVDAGNAREDDALGRPDFGRRGEPFLVNNAVCFLTWEALHAIDAESGEQLWTYEDETMLADVKVGKNVYVHAFGLSERYSWIQPIVVALDPLSGEPVRSFEKMKLVGVHDGIVYLDKTDKSLRRRSELMAVEEDSGNTLWTYKNVGRGYYSSTSESTVHRGMFYYVQWLGGDLRGRTYLYAIDVRTGR